MPRLDQIADLEKRFLLPTYNRYPVGFERGKGVFLYDFEGKILLALEVVEENALPALKAHGISVIGREKKAFFKIGDLVEARHGFIVERALGRRMDRRSGAISQPRVRSSEGPSGISSDQFRRLQTGSI